MSPRHPLTALVTPSTLPALPVAENLPRGSPATLLGQKIVLDAKPQVTPATLRVRDAKLQVAKKIRRNFEKV
jgi:hypothetical protein